MLPQHRRTDTAASRISVSDYISVADPDKLAYTPWPILTRGILNCPLSRKSTARDVETVFAERVYAPDSIAVGRGWNASVLLILALHERGRLVAAPLDKPGNIGCA